MPAPPAARILIVDDQPALTKSLCDTLGAEGYETVGCNSGQAALEALGSTKFDLLLTDLMMPGMDGIALCQAAQKSDSNLVSILMTGAGSIASAVKAMKAGALDYITKPLELSVILAVLSRSLDVRRLRMENAAEEVESISRNLRPGVLKELGLVAVLHDTTRKFAERTGVSVKLAGVELPARLPADTELTLYRILQETLKNVEQHARARQVTIHLAKRNGSVQFIIKDDGIGFDPDHLPVGSKGKGGLGLLGMRERASSVGGVLRIKSVRRVGTEIDVHIPLRPDVPPASGVAQKLLKKDQV